MFYKIDQLISGYLNPECDKCISTIVLLIHLEKLKDPFSEATEEYAQEVVQVWKPPYLRGIDWFN